MPSPTQPTPADFRANWPGFRGPNGNAHAFVSSAPTNWDGATGAGILWKTAVARNGKSSPVVWGERVFLTGADEQALEIFCFNADSGEIRWRKCVPQTVASDRLGDITDDTGRAAPTMATDGERVFAIFASGDIVCLTLDGDNVWARNLGVPDLNYGYGSSLQVAKGRVIVQYDATDKCRLLALDAATGETVWETPRDVATAWASPLIVDTPERTEIILSADPLIASYDADTGKELWSLECLSGEVAPSPGYADGIVVAANEVCGAKAVRLDDPNLLWESSDDVPDVASPLVTSNGVFMASSGGVVTCLDTASGDVMWQQEFGNSFWSSPVLAANNVYVFDSSGVARVFKAAHTYEEIGSPALGEPVVSTPAFVGGRIYVRGDKHLFCIGGN